MSLTKSLHSDEKYKAGPLGRTMTMTGLGIAVLFMVVSIVLGKMHGDNFKRFLYAYVVGWSYIASISIGMLWLVLLHHLTRSRWSTVVRRIAEAIAGAFPLIWIAGLGFVLPVVAGNTDLYYWLEPPRCGERRCSTPRSQHKLGWLSPTFFARPLLHLRRHLRRRGLVLREEVEGARRLG